MTNRTDFPSSSRVDLSTEEDQKTTEIKERCHFRDLGIEGEEKFEILGGEGQATSENKLQFSSFEDGYEIIEVSDLDRIQIAGFSKQKLLEMCNFCKISYGNNDEKLDSRYKTKAELINEGYSIIPFYYNGRNKRCAGFVFTKDKEITIAYRGTKDFDDVMTDVSAAFTPEFLPEGGKMHSGFYNAFKDSWSSLGRILEDHAKKQLLEIKDFRINCTGHSMGAALATITALYLKKVKSAEHVRVATFGSPRVFDSRGAEIYEKLLGENTIRVTNLSDPIPMFPLGSMGFKHVGEPLKIKTGNFIVNCLVTDLHIVGKYYHKTDTYYGCIQDMKPEDFQPDNDVSRYYYLSYVVAVPYYITTTTLATPYYLFLSAISNTEQRYFEREMKFADDRRLMSLKDNKNGLVIHALGNAMVSLGNPLVISHIECNINGRAEGLKFNIYDIASFVNSNYHLNRNNMRLRQLCKTEDVPVKEVPNLISAENHVSGNRNTISDLVNEPAISSRAVNEAGSKQLQSPEPKSTSSQQPQKNVVDKRKNIMENGEASKQEPIGSNREGGEMGNGNKNKSIKEKLSNAINSINPGTVERLLNQEDTNITEFVLKEALDQVKKKIENLKAGDKKQDQENRLKRMIELLETKLKSISARTTELSVSDNVEDVIATTSSQSASVISSDGEEKQTPDQPTTGEITLQIGDEPRLESKGDQLDSPLHSSGSSLDSDYSKLESSNGQSGGKCARTPSDSNGDSLSFEKIDEEPVVTMTDSEDSSSECSEVPSIGNLTNDEAPLLDKENSTLEGDSSLQQDTQPKTLVPSGGASSVVTEGDQPAPTPEPTLTPTPEPTLSSTSKKSEQVNNTTPPNTKSSNLHIIAASALAVAGVALGVAIAVHLEMLAVGIAVGVCCLVAATVMCHYKWPSSFIENNQIEKVALNEEKGPAATPV